MAHSRRRFFQASALGTAMFAVSSSDTQAASDARTAPALDLEAQPISVLKRLSHRSRRALRFAVDEAAETGDGMVSSNYLLIGLAAEAEYSGASWLANLGLTLDDLCTVSEKLRLASTRLHESNNHLPVSQAARQCVLDGIAEAMRMGYQKAEPEHLLLGILQNPDVDAQLLLHEMWIDAAGLASEALASMPTWGSVHHRFG
ncbi:Clp protease N-terminal domain-containing protein [Rosistilla oblonga]|uniref:ATP-dependent Clp protease ATP-binding subunit ClpC1 n=1 Tax=Rosistilla oblonga TaxID=2527990 RepID=A0A518IR54_9BACT|nr:Clp protease N-terminal domain-containing protein [Rosistilla oblonga]QDV55560.1 ATP-dependent Clp protease ATP-binding subunit ClpC1 [Rosistilla oblonga]